MLAADETPSCCFSLPLLPRSSRRSFLDDPLTLAIAPPIDETPDQRLARELAEAEAKRRNDEIDEQLRRERESGKKKKPVKLLLLGQSESGKTATLKSAALHTPLTQ